MVKLHGKNSPQGASIQLTKQALLYLSRNKRNAHVIECANQGDAGLSCACLYQGYRYGGPKNPRDMCEYLELPQLLAVGHVKFNPECRRSEHLECKRDFEGECPILEEVKAVLNSPTPPPSRQSPKWCNDLVYLHANPGIARAFDNLLDSLPYTDDMIHIVQQLEARKTAATDTAKCLIGEGNSCRTAWNTYMERTGGDPRSLVGSKTRMTNVFCLDLPP